MKRVAIFCELRRSQMLIVGCFSKGELNTWSNRLSLIHIWKVESVYGLTERHEKIIKLNNGKMKTATLEK